MKLLFNGFEHLFKCLGLKDLTPSFYTGDKKREVKKMLNLMGFKFPANGHRLMLQGAAGLAIGIILGAALFTIIGLPTVEPFLGSQALQRFSSYMELLNFLNNTISVRGYENDMKYTVFGGAQTLAPAEYSKTNIQVAGVDEADILKCDGEYIYLATANGIIISRAYPPENAMIMSKISFNRTVCGLFINNNRLIVFENSYGSNIYSVVNSFYLPYRSGETYLQIYDIEDKANPRLIREIAVNGSYFTSRMIGNNVYFLVSQPASIVDGNILLPAIRDNDGLETVDAKKIYYSNVTDFYYCFTTVVSIDVANDTAPKYEVLLIGATSTVYVSKDNIYAAIQHSPMRTFLKASSTSVPLEETGIHRIHISNGEIKYEASGYILGRLLNQFSMDEYNEHLRVATTTWYLARNPQEAISSNHVYVLNSHLNVTGKIEDIASGETIYSTRFIDERCYLVTFKKIDPLFVIDMSNPAKPEMLGSLKITGYSNYLHPYDENHIIGIGKETVEAEEGSFAWYQGVKISLFDVSDVEHPIEEGEPFVIGSRGTDSPVLQDHKAFLFDGNRNLLAMPVLVAEIDPAKYPSGVPSNIYGDYVWQGVYVFNITNSGISLRGRITHIENLDEFMKSGYYFSSPYMIKRCLYIDNVLYTVSDMKIQMNNLTNLENMGKIELS